jgi:hypothetical protein
MSPYTQGVLCLLPALLLFVVLRLRSRPPGERLILALRARLAGKRRRRAATRIAAGVRVAVVSPRGGCLIASALAGRAPPVATLAA